MASDIEAALNAVHEAQTGLTELWDQVEAGRDSARVRQHLRRWKDASADAIRAHVSPAEAAQFEQLAVDPNWVASETLHAVIHNHGAFLEALEKDLRRRPGIILALAPASVAKVMDGKPFTFLSHASQDAPLAAHLETSLRAAAPSLEVFRTTRIDQIPAGRPWFQHITDHLQAATQFVVLVTPNSQKRPWVCFETGAAWRTNRTCVLALGGGLSAGDTIEPLRQLQLLSLEDRDQASQVFIALGTTLTNPGAFAERARQIGRVVPASPLGKARVEGSFHGAGRAVALRLQNTGTTAAHRIRASVNGEPLEASPYFARRALAPIGLLAAGAHVDFRMLTFDGAPRVFRVQTEWAVEGGEPETWASDLTRP